MRNYKSWYWLAAGLQFLTAAVHSLSFLNHPKPDNETEKMLLDLMHSYRSPNGGFTMEGIMIALSACMTCIFLFSSLVNAWLLRKTRDEVVLGGILTINLVIFGILSVVMIIHTFLPPILMTSLVFVLLLVAVLVRKLIPQK